MTQWRKKPVIVEAVQIATSTSILDPRWFYDAICDGTVAVRQQNPIIIAVKTLEGTMAAYEGDWIVRGVEGEIYPVKDSIFRKTYEPVQ